MDEFQNEMIFAPTTDLDREARVWAKFDSANSAFNAFDGRQIRINDFGGSLETMPLIRQMVLDLYAQAICGKS
jgi:hypothetical protein